MTPNELLLKAIQERQQKLTEFNGGILTADRYVKTISECVGSDLCYRFAATKTVSFADVMQKAAKTLTYNNEDMEVEDIYGKDYNWKDADGDELELPKNTLMVFKHILTTPKKDRDGDIMRTGGAKVDPKMLLLWQHVHTLPIGKLLVIAEHNTKVLSVVSAIVDVNDLAHDAAVMVENKMGRFSHGFRALEFSKIKEHQVDEGGFDVKSFEVMEESLVSVPSNTDSEVQEVIVSLVESSKLTSPMMKAVGKSYREKMPKSVAVGTDVGKLQIDLNLTVNGKSMGDTKHGEGTGTKCTGKTGCSCGCGGASPSKEADEDAAGEKDADDKEVMMCPKCGANMKNGVCEKCGYKTGNDKEDKSTPTRFKMADIKSVGYVYSGSLEGSWESVGWGLRSQAAKFMEDAGALATRDDNYPSAYVDIVGTYPEYAILAVSDKSGYRYYKATWQPGADGPEFKGVPKEVQINTTTQIMEKMVKCFKTFEAEKVGRRVSAGNVKRLSDAHDAVSEVHDKEHLLSKGGRALCKDAISNIKSVLESGLPKEEVSAGDAITAMAEFLTKATLDQRKRMGVALAAFDVIEEIQQNTKEFTELVGSLD